MYQTLSELASLCKRYDNIWCVFRFTVLTAVHLQNVNAKFSQGRVEALFYPGDEENVYISVPQIYPGQYVPNFVTIGLVFRLYIKNILVCIFSAHSVYAGWRKKVPNFA